MNQLYKRLDISYKNNSELNYQQTKERFLICLMVILFSKVTFINNHKPNELSLGPSACKQNNELKSIDIISFLILAGSIQ